MRDYTSDDLLFEAQTITVTVRTPSPQVEPENRTDTDEAAVLGLEVNLFEDAGGVPGNLITNDTVEIGESFFVEIAAEDLREVPEGIGGLSINATWAPEVLQEIDQPFDPTELVTAAFPLYRSGSLDNSAGRIEDLGGSSFRSSDDGEPIGIDGPERFSLLHFRAIGLAVESPFSVEIGASGVGIVQGSLREASDLAIEAQVVSVIENLQPPQIQLTATSGPDLSTVQFTTVSGNGGADEFMTSLVRPAFPDAKQFVEVTNTGPSPLTIQEIRVNAPDVSVDVPLTASLVLQPGQVKRIHLQYAPSIPNSRDTSTQSFDVSNGLVILSNAENAPRLTVALLGESTYNADVTYDGIVNLADVVTFDDHYGLHGGDLSYDPSVDPNGDGSVDMGDFGPLNVHYRLSRPKPAPALLPVAAAADAVFGASQAEDSVASTMADEMADVIADVADGWLTNAENDGDDRNNAPVGTLDLLAWGLTE